MIRLVTILLLVVGTSVAAFFGSEMHLQKLIPDQVVRINGFANLSGIAYWPAHNTLIGVANNGELAEISLDGTVLRRAFDRKRRLGDITLTSEPGYALVTDAQHGHILRLDLAQLRFIADTAIHFDSPQTDSPQQLIEGLAIEHATGRLILAIDAQPASLLFTDSAIATPRDVILLNTPSVSSVISDNIANLLVVSRDSGLLLTSSEGIPAGSWHPVKGQHLTGAALVPGIGLVIATGQNPAQLLIFTSLTTWEDLRRALTS